MNYHEIMKKEIEKITKENEVPTILLHSCCAPCSSVALEYLANVFKVTIFYYNPNIDEETEYQKRKQEQKRFIKELKTKYPISFLDCPYDQEAFMKIAKGNEQDPEKGQRCYKCYYLRLEKTAQTAKEKNFDYFGTTLSVSPYKVSSWLNQIGLELQEKYQIKYLCSDFKKENGYQKSIAYSQKYHLYRQSYCGCIYQKINARSKL